MQKTDIGIDACRECGSGISGTPATATLLLVSGFPSPTTAGVSHNVTLTAEDAYSNLATGYTGTVHLSSSDGQATLPAELGRAAGRERVQTSAVAVSLKKKQNMT